MHCYSAITVLDQETRKDHLVINREKEEEKKKEEKKEKKIGGERERILKETCVFVT